MNSPTGPASPEQHVVLIVEDDDVDRIALKRVLRTIGPDVTVLEAATVEQARRHLEGPGAFKWVLSDHRLPDGEGRDVLAASGRLRPDTPVIILTGQGDEALAARLIQEGARDYIPKALLSPERLAASMRNAEALVEAEAAARIARRGDALLARIGAELVGTVDRAEVVDAAAREVLGDLAEWCAVDFEVESGGFRRLVRVNDGVDVPALRDGGESPGAWVETWRSGEHRGPAVLEGDERALLSGGDGLPPDITLTAAGMPIYGEGRLLAVMAFGRVGAGRAYRSQELSILRLYGERVAVALEKAGLYEQLQRALAARDEVLAFVAHDLRNPLNAIFGSVTNLLALELGEEARQRQHRLIETAARRMTRLVDDLLDVARIEEGALRVEPVPTSPRSLIDEAVAMVEVRAAESSVTLETELEGGMGRILVDPTRGVQILTNLLENACRHSPSGGRVVVAASADGGFVRFSVRDEGPGLTEAQMEHLFDRFWQADRPRKGRAGLGLTISRGLVELHGGEIGVSSPGGAEFEFTLPIAPD